MIDTSNATVIPFPAGRMSAEDRHALHEAALATPFEIEYRFDREGRLAALLYRCGHLQPSYRIDRAGHDWRAVPLMDGRDLPGGEQAPSPESLLGRLAALDKSSA